MKQQVIFKLFRAVGDIIVFTNFLRCFSKSYQNIDFDVITPYPEITYLNENLTKLPKDKNIEVIDFSNIEMNEYRKSGMHYSSAYIDWFNKQYNMDVQQDSIIPELFLSNEEKDKDYIYSKYGIKGNFWLFNAGIKIDIPLKAYPILYWNYILDSLNELNYQLIQVGSDHHVHPVFNNIKSLVGKTQNLRDFLSLCYHAQGVITPISMLMHVAAAFNKSCIVIGGGRENPRWEMYSNHCFLHTVGLLDCCKNDGCWKKQRSECSKLVGDPEYSACMYQIKPQMIINYVRNF